MKAFYLIIARQDELLLPTETNTELLIRHSILRRRNILWWQVCYIGLFFYPGINSILLPVPGGRRSNVIDGHHVMF